MIKTRCSPYEFHPAVTRSLNIHHRAVLAMVFILALVVAPVLLPQPGLLTATRAEAANSPSGLSATDEQTKARAAESFGNLPLYFVENRGQLDKRVNYYVQGSDKTIYFTNQGLTFLLNPKSEAEPETLKADKKKSQRWSLKLDFVGARPGVRPEGREQTGATFSYFKGRRSEWQAGLKSYSEIVYRELWPGIDLVYAGTVNRMKYTFVVKPGADPNRIKLAWRGASGVKLNAAGELEVTTPAGGFTDERPVSWQETNGQQIDVATKYRIEAKGKQQKQASNAAITYGFELGEYDRSRELVIDPAVLVYCGYIGGSNTDDANGIAVDSAGNAYLAGDVNSTEATFPVTPGLDVTFNGGSTDAFVAKLNASGTALVYCSYLGGSDNDDGFGIAVDSAGNAYVSGETFSNEAAEGFPVIVGPDLTFNDSGGRDAFVAKLNASGTVLVYSGYIGGSNTDQAHGIAVDSAGNAYVTGQTSSTEASFPVTVGPDLTHNGGDDAFVAKVNPSGTALVYSGYIGGSSFDQVRGIALDNAGNAYVTGQTSSTEASFPVTVGPDLTHNGGNDAFVAKVNPSGTALVYSGYIGGSSFDQARGIALDNAGNAYVTGFTQSDEATFPVTVGPDLTFNGSFDAFVTKVNASGTALVYSGYIGGSDFDFGSGIAVDSVGNAYVTGQTSSTEASFPVTVGPDLTHNGGDDAFVGKVNPGGTALAYSGYIGGSASDSGVAVAVDSLGNAYVTGQTQSTEADFPATVGPDLTFNGGRDSFVAKIGVTLCAALVQRAYVTNGFSNVSVIDTATNTVVATVQVGLGPVGVAVTPNGAFVYVANVGDNTVSVISAATNTVIATVPVGLVPLQLAITPNGAFVYVTNIEGTVSVIATATNTVIATVPVGNIPEGIAITPNGAFVYVANLESLNIAVIETTTNTVVATIPLGKKPLLLAITPNGAFAYVATPQTATASSNTVTVINTATNAVTATIPVGLGPFGVAITPNGASAYVTNLDNTVSVINTTTNTVTATVPVGSDPIGVAVRPDGAAVYVTNTGENTVSIISTATNTVVDTITLGDRPFSVAFSTRSPATPDLTAQVQDLINAGTLTQNQGAGLIDKLNQVSAKIDNCQTGAVCQQLNSFINQVNAFINNGSLTQAQGQALIDAANAIKADNGCQ